MILKVSSEMCASTRECGLVGFFQFEASFWDDWDQTPAETFTRSVRAR